MTSSKKTDLHTLNNATIVLSGEDHTLGNALRYMLVQDSRVNFAGYSIPHPTQQELNLRLQTCGAPVVEVLNNGIDNLIQICDILSETYKQALVNHFKAKENPTTD